MTEQSFQHAIGDDSIDDVPSSKFLTDTGVLGSSPPSQSFGSTNTLGLYGNATGSSTSSTSSILLPRLRLAMGPMQCRCGEKDKEIALLTRCVESLEASLEVVKRSLNDAEARSRAFTRDKDELSRRIKDKEALLEEERTNWAQTRRTLEAELGSLETQLRESTKVTEKRSRELDDMSTALQNKQHGLHSQEEKLQAREDHAAALEESCAKRERNLKLREEEATRLDKEIHLRSKELQERIHRHDLSWAERMKELDLRQEVLASQEQNADGREKDLQERQVRVEALEKDLGSRRLDLEAQITQFDARALELDAWKDSITVQIQEVEAALTARSTELDEREQQLQVRTGELDDRSRVQEELAQAIKAKAEEAEEVLQRAKKEADKIIRDAGRKGAAMQLEAGARSRRTSGSGEGLTSPLLGLAGRPLQNRTRSTASVSDGRQSPTFSDDSASLASESAYSDAVSLRSYDSLPVLMEGREIDGSDLASASSRRSSLDLSNISLDGEVGNRRHSRIARRMPVPSFGHPSSQFEGSDAEAASSTLTATSVESGVNEFGEQTSPKGRDRSYLNYPKTVHRKRTSSQPSFPQGIDSLLNDGGERIKPRRRVTSRGESHQRSNLATEIA